jgi:hypothetical protein
MSWPWLLALTCAVELPIVVALAPASARRRIVGDGLAANLLTWPLAFWLVTGGHAGWLAVELGVAAVETLVYAQVTRLALPRALGVAVAANGVTAAMSFLC